MTAQDAQLRDFVAANADLIIDFFTQDTGIAPGKRLAAHLFATYFDNRFYLRSETTCDNIPWLLARTIRTYNLHGQIIRPGSEAERAITRHAHGSVGVSAGDNGGKLAGGRLRYRFDQDNRLEVDPGVFEPATIKPPQVEFSLQRHVVENRSKRLPRETVDLVIAAWDSATTHTLLTKTIVLRTEEFRKHAENRKPPTQEGQRMIEIARKKLDRHLRRKARTRSSGKPDGSSRRHPHGGASLALSDAVQRRRPKAATDNANAN